MNQNTNAAIEQFILEMTLIDPISKIIAKLENREYRDCDIKWLNDKLFNFTNIAAKTLGKSMVKIDLVENDGLLNEYKRNKFIEAFRTILNYFKQWN